ncbi:MAG: DUF454 family protein [Isosphaeraceae bacterium]
MAATSQAASAVSGAGRGGTRERGVECCERSGVVEIRDTRLFRAGQEPFCRALAEAAVMDLGAELAEVDLGASICRLVFGPGRFDRAELAERAAAAVRAATPRVTKEIDRSEPLRPEWTEFSAFAGDGVMVVREWGGESAAGGIVPFDEAGPADSRSSRRVADLAMAGGSLLMTIAGVILPGIPTLPFLIMTAKYAARVSPGFERLVEDRPWLAALLAQAEPQEGQPIDWWAIGRMIGLAALFVAAIMILHPPMPIVLAVELGVMAFFAWRELRTEAAELEPSLAMAA